MLDKRSWTRSEWTMIRKANRLWFEFENGFCGVVEMLEVSEPFCVGEHKLTICDQGVTWVQCAWKDADIWATAMFDKNGNLFQIYFDICDEVNLDGERSWFTDLILDVVYNPDGTVNVLDENELTEAYESHLISKEQRMKAENTAIQLVFDLKSHSKQVNEWFLKLYKKSSENTLK